MNFSFLLTTHAPLPLPRPRPPVAHSCSLTYAFFLCFCKMPSRCWQRVTAGRLCQCHAHHTHSHTHTWLQLCVYGVHLPLLSGCIITVIIIIFTIVCSISVLPCASGQPVNAFTHSHAHSHSHSYSRKPIGKSLRNPSTRVSLNTREGRCVSYPFLDCWLNWLIRVIAWFGDLFVGQWMTCCLAYIQMSVFVFT